METKGEFSLTNVFLSITADTVSRQEGDVGTYELTHTLVSFLFFLWRALVSECDIKYHLLDKVSFILNWCEIRNQKEKKNKENNYDSQLQRLTLPDIFLVQLFSFEMRVGQRSGVVWVGQHLGAVWVGQRLGAVWVGQRLGDRTRRADGSD